LIKKISHDERGYTVMDLNNYDIIADLYDIYVPVNFDIAFFINETKNTSGEVLELMSGTGRVSIPLLEAGVKLTCVDISAKSNQILKNKLEQKGLMADVYQMDVCDLEIPKKFDIIIIPFQSFAHITSPADQRKALSRIHQHLLPKGTFICTLGNPTLRKQSVDSQLQLAYQYPMVEQQGKLLLWILEKFDQADDHVVHALEFFEEYDVDGVMTSKRLMELHFRLSGRGEFEDLLKTTGFSIKAFYGDYTYGEFDENKSPFMIWLLENTVQ
jgi:SAM-dependent methyltransferase